MIWLTKEYEKGYSVTTNEEGEKFKLLEILAEYFCIKGTFVGKGDERFVVKDKKEKQIILYEIPIKKYNKIAKNKIYPLFYIE